jgi:cytochrome c-type biogenesis protein CcmH
MTLWFVMALMTAAAIFAVLWPLSRNRPLASGSDVEVYRDQLDEIGRDRAAGLIGEAEAEAARIEVSRRLLAAADAPAAAPAVAGPKRRRAVAVAALVLLPLGAAGLYLMLGSPDLPGQPLAARREAPGQQSIPELVARIEAHLEQNPEDGRGWEVVGPVYMRMGRYDEAVTARRNALKFLGSDPQREGDLGEALTAAANGVVTAEAKEAFDRALKLDADDFRGRYFAGLAAEQDGRPKDAAEIWRKLLASAPPGSGWAGFVRESLVRVDPTAAAAAPGPNAADVAAAGEMSPEQRETMIRGMVARLSERLKQDGSDVDGWLRLVRAYTVLGEKDQARASAGDARRALNGNDDGLRHLDELIKELGLEG